MNTLEKEYMVLPNGNFHKTVSFLRGRCYWVTIYMVLKNKYPELSDITNYFLNDFTVELIMKNHLDIVKLDTNFIYSNDAEENKFTLLNYEHLKQGTNAIKILEEYILKDKYVIVETINELLPFSIFYISQFEANNYKSKHVILFINFDDTYFYYVEDPVMLNSQAILHKNGICKIKKEDLCMAIGQYLKCIIVEKTDVKSSSINEKNLLILKKSINNYYLPIKTLSDNLSAYYGSEAIKKLILISKEGYIISSDHENISKHTEVFLNNSFHIIRGNRYIYQQFFISAFKNHLFPVNEKLLHLFEQEIINWTYIWNLAERDMFKDQQDESFILNARFEKFFTNILLLENQIIEELELMIK